MKAGLDLGVVERTVDFALLEQEWDDLYRCAIGVTPFQSWAWMYSWWEAYGTGLELRILTLRAADGLLVGLVPLMIKRRRGVSRLLFIGTRRNDYQDILVRQGWADQAAEEVLRAIDELPGWQVADLHQLRPGSTGWHVLNGWRGLRSRASNPGSPMVEAKHWEELIASLSKNQRSTVRRTLRRAASDGVRSGQVAVEDAGPAARRLVALHRELWQGRNMTREHSTARWASFIETATQRMLARGLGTITEFRQGDEVVMTVFWLIGRDFVGFYHSGVSRKVLQRYQWNALLVQAGNDVAHTHGATYLDLLRGEQDYKMQWASRVTPSTRFILGRNVLTWSVYAGLWQLRTAVERFVFSPRCPEWVREGARRVRRILP